MTATTCHAIVRTPQGRIRTEGSATFVPAERIAYAITQLTRLPGGNMVHKTVNTALLTGSVDTLKGISATPLSRIHNAVEQLGCHDTNNFSAVLRRKTDLSSQSGGPTLALNPAGLNRADELVRQLLLT